MCGSSAPFMLAGTYLKMKAAVDRGSQESEFWRKKASMSDEDALAAERDARTLAQKIRIAGEEGKSTARTMGAASNIMVNEGAVLRAEQEIHRRSENDALEVILEGTRRVQRLTDEAGMQRQAARNARKRGDQEALGSFLGAGAQSSGGGWS